MYRERKSGGEGEGRQDGQGGHCEVGSMFSVVRDFACDWDVGLLEVEIPSCVAESFGLARLLYPSPWFNKAIFVPGGKTSTMPRIGQRR